MSRSGLNEKQLLGKKSFDWLGYFVGIGGAIAILFWIFYLKDRGGFWIFSEYSSIYMLYSPVFYFLLVAGAFIRIGIDALVRIGRESGMLTEPMIRLKVCLNAVFVCFALSLLFGFMVYKSIKIYIYFSASDPWSRVVTVVQDEYRGRGTSRGRISAHFDLHGALEYSADNRMNIWIPYKQKHVELRRGDEICVSGRAGRLGAVVTRIAHKSDPACGK